MLSDKAIEMILNIKPEITIGGFNVKTGKYEKFQVASYKVKDIKKLCKEVLKLRKLIKE